MDEERLRQIGMSQAKVRYRSEAGWPGKYRDRRSEAGWTRQAAVRQAEVRQEE